MQRIQYIREGMNNYMVMPCFRRLDRTSYGDTLLELAEVPYFLNYEIREIDGEQNLYYTLKYRTSLKQVLGNLQFTFERVRNMISSVVSALKQTEVYLLKQDCIVWNSDCVFMEIHTGKLAFTYHPGMENKTDSLKSFLMEFIQYINKSDQKTYMFLMGFYNLITNPDCTSEQLTKYLKMDGGSSFINTKAYLSEEDYEYDVKMDKDVRPDPEKLLGQKYTSEQKSVSEKESTLERKGTLKRKDTSEQEEEKILGKKSSLAVVILTVVNLLVVCCLLFEVWSYQYIWVLIVGIFLLIITLIIQFRVDNSDNPDQIMEEYLNMQANESMNENSFVINEVPEIMQTTILTQKDSRYEIVVEDKPRELYLKGMKPENCQNIMFEKNSVVIGSMAEGCDYLLEEKGISRMHAKVLKRQDGLYLMDLNSTNGTYLNDSIIDSGKEYLLQEGDVIAFAYIVAFVVAKR